MKKALFVFVSILCVLIIIKYPAQPNQQFQDIDPFIVLYQIEEVKFSELKITAWAKIKNKNSSKQQIENILTLLEKEYNLTSQVNLIPIHDETYLIINLEGIMLGDRHLQNKMLERIFEYFGSKPNINQTAVFYMSGFQSVYTQKENIYYFFSEINGIIVEGIRDEALVSYSGYTPHFEDSVVSRGKAINVNIASRYHNVDNKTYLYMGTPLIHGQY